MKLDVKIMILYAGYGDGHYQASKAIRDKFLENGIQRAALHNVFAAANPLMDTLSRFVYLKSCSYTPELYGLSYYLTKNMRQDAMLFRWLNTTGMEKLLDLLERERPDAIIQTFPFLAMPELKLQHRLQTPVYTVMTDYALHHRWIHPMTEKYFVATDDLRSELLSRGVPESRVVASGIPIRREFSRKADVQAVRDVYALRADRRTVLILAGAYGVLQGIESVIECLAVHANLQIVLICGKNDRLKERIGLRFGDVPNLFIRGFEEHIERWMAVSDCVVTKAGGLTLSESLAMGLPIFVFNPLPGQEKENALYLRHKGVASLANDPGELTAGIIGLLQDPRRLARVRRNIALIAKSDAAATVVGQVLADLQLKQLSPV